MWSERDRNTKWRTYFIACKIHIMSHLNDKYLYNQHFNSNVIRSFIQAIQFSCIVKRDSWWHKNYSLQTKQSAILRSNIYIIRRHTPMLSATKVPADYVPSPCWQPMKRYEYTGSEAPAVVAETCIGVFVLNKDIRGRGYLLHFYISVSLFFPFSRNFKCTC